MLNDGDMYLTLISEARFVMEVVGDVTLIFSNNSLLSIKRLSLYF